MGFTLLEEKSFALLMSITELGGVGTKKNVLDNISSKMYISFSPEDLEVKKNRPELHWRNDLAYIRKALVTEGYVDDKETDRWEITKKGKEQLLLLSDKISKVGIDELKKLSKSAIDRAALYIGDLGADEYKEFLSENSKLAGVLNETDAERLLKVRIGQGTFKKRLIEIDNKCKVCGLGVESLLIASHIKPWKDSNDFERLDTNNGFLLCPIHDSLFDKGYISFEDNGKIMISSLLASEVMHLLNINKMIHIDLNAENRNYLDWHRQKRFKTDLYW